MTVWYSHAALSQVPAKDGTLKLCVHCSVYGDLRIYTWALRCDFT